MHDDQEMITMATILTPADLAAELGTDARTARKFLRSITPKDEQPGKGARWSIEKRQVRSLRTKFAEFTAAAEKAKAERDAKQATVEAPTEEPAEVEGEVDEEPTDAELAEIEDEG